MTQLNYEQIVEITKQQEDMLRFERFTNRDAMKLGCFIADRAGQADIAMAVAIRKPNGNVVFQYCSDGTTLSNEKWMRRKFNTVALTEGCSLRAWAASIIKGQDLAAQGLDPMNYALCGGGFPIKLRTGEMVAVLTVSNLPHLKDHAFLIDALCAYLDVKDVPRI